MRMATGQKRRHEGTIPLRVKEEANVTNGALCTQGRGRG
jgi:hypothetical protein